MIDLFCGVFLAGWALYFMAIFAMVVIGAPILIYYVIKYLSVASKPINEEKLEKAFRKLRERRDQRDN